MRVWWKPVDGSEQNQKTTNGQGFHGGPEAGTLLPDYYLRNFEHVLEVVLTSAGHLFTPEELACFARFSSLSRGARQLYVRLFLRKGPLFRCSRLSYPEIPSISAAMEELVACDFAAFPEGPEENLSGAEFFWLFPQGELKALARSLGVPTGGRKGELIENLAALPEALTLLRARERFVMLRHRDLFSLLPVLFFGNRSQDLSEFVLTDLERVRYPSYAISRDLPLFPDRAALFSYLEATERLADGFADASPEVLSSQAEQILEALCAWASPPAHRRRVDPGRYRIRLAFLLARELERSGELTRALSLYEKIVACGPEPTLRAEVADRLGLIARKLKEAPRFSAASERLLSRERLDAISRFQIERRRALLGLGPDPRRALLHPKMQEIELTPAGYNGSRALYRSRSGEPVFIEEAVLEMWAGKGVFAENILYRNLFGLLFWDVIYAPLPGMFQHPFQMAPLDISTEYFFWNRKELFQERLAALHQQNLAEEVERAFRAHYGELSPFVAWEAYDLETLLFCVGVLGRPVLCILEHIAQYPRRHGRGLPDLLLWPEGKALLVEVKGPGDQLQIEQLLWHDKLLRLGFDVRLVRVKRRE